jgi:adenosylhomocysteine nucleosidase
MTSRLGLVVALSPEARSLVGGGVWQRRSGWPIRRLPIVDDGELVCIRSGIGPQNAYAAARQLITEGVSALIVAGVAGGLNPVVKAGELIVPDAVLEKTVDGGYLSWGTHAVCVSLGFERLISKGLCAHRGTLFSAQHACLTPQDKDDVFRCSGAQAVDMESAAVGRAASEADLGFYAFRAVCDPANTTIPGDLIDVLKENGSVDWTGLLPRLLCRPSLFGEILRLRRGFSAALTALKTGWHAQMKHPFASLLAMHGKRMQPNSV